MLKKISRILVAVLFLAAAAVISVVIFRAAPEPARAAGESRPTPVEVTEVRSGTQSSRVSATGLVRAAKQVTLSPEVSGRIVTRSEALVPGGRLDENEVVARIDGRNYQLALRQESARVRSAELELQTEESRRAIAEQEWDLLGDGRPREEASLVLRQPHVDNANAALDSARSSASLARLNLGRATLRAPFNAIVIDTEAEVGQLLSAGSPMATLVGTDQLWVRVSVPVSQLETLDIPGVNATEGSAARVIHSLGGEREVVREGRVLRLEGQLDADTRTARLLIAVDHPFDSPDGAIPLLPGAYVRVELEGRSMEDVFELPRAAVHNGREVWIVTAENTLSQRTFEQLWGNDDVLYARSDGLRSGDRVVTSPLSLPIEGTAVQLITEADNSSEDEQ